MATVQELLVKITGDASEFESAINKTKTASESVGQSFEQVGSKISAAGATATAAFTVPIVGAATAGITKFADFDKTMQLVNSTMNNTPESANTLRTAIDSAAAQSIFSMSEAATATLNFARAGLTAEEAANALAPAMNLAAGEGGNLDTVSAGLVATINGFGDSFTKTGDYADVFAAACNNSALDVDSLSRAMATAAPIFATAGYSVNDAALYMGVMADAGIPASEAANSLKTGLARLVSPAKEGYAAMKELGIEVTNADGSMKDSITIQKELHDAFAGLSESEQIAAASAIFGKNQMSKWLALINTAPEDVKELSTSIDDCKGTTDDMAEAMMSGFGGSIEQLKSSIDVLMTSLGELIAQYLQPIIDKAQEWVNKFNAMSDAEKDQVIHIAAMVAAVGPLLLVGGKLISGIGTIINLIGTVSSVFGTAGAAAGAAGTAGSAGLGAIATAAAPVVAIIAAVGTAIYSIVESFGGVEGALGRLKELFSSIWENIQHRWEEAGLQDKIDDLKEKFKGLTDALGDMEDFWNVLFEIFGKIASYIGMELVTAFGAIIEIVGDVCEYIQGLVDILGGLGEIIVGVFTGNTDKIKEGATRMWEGVKETFVGYMTALGDIVGGIVDVIVGIFKNLKYLLIGDPIVIDMWDGITAAFSEGIKNAIEFVSGMVSDIVDFFTDLKGKVTEKISELWESAKEKFNNLKEDVVESFSNMKEKATEKIHDLLQYSKEKFKNLKEDVVEKVSDMKDNLVNKVTDMKDTAVKNFTTIKDEVTNKFNATKEKVVGAVTTMKDTAVEKFNNIKDNAVNKFDELKENIVNKMSESSESVKENTDKMKESTSDNFAGMEEAVDERTSKIKDDCDNNFSEAKEAADEQFSNMKESVGDTMAEMKEDCSDQMDEITDNFGSVDLTDIGGNIIQGLWDGLSDKMSSVIDWISEKARSIRDTFSSIMHMGSPSKVFRQYGQWIDEGLVLGLDDGSASIDREINKLASGVNVGFNKSLDVSGNGLNRGSTVINLNGDYMFQDKQSMDYFMNRLQLALDRVS